MFSLMRVLNRLECLSNGENGSQCLVIFQQRYNESAKGLPISQISKPIDSIGNLAIGRDGM